MLGRGAIIRPWLFSEIARTVYGLDILKQTLSLPDVYATFIEAMKADYRPENQLGRLKSFTHYFARNYKFGHSLASKVQSSRSMDEAIERAGMFFEKSKELNSLY